MDELLALFSIYCDAEKASQKCKLLADNHGDAIALEKISVSEFSPGPVVNQEYIARQIFSPIHVEDDNSIKSTAFDDVANKGLSVNRMSLVEVETIHSNGLEKQNRDNAKALESGRPEKANREYLGFVQTKVETVRDYYDEDARVYSVYDSSLNSSREHADICMIKQDTRSNDNVKWVKMFRRKKLQEMFSPLTTPA